MKKIKQYIKFINESVLDNDTYQNILETNNRHELELLREAYFEHVLEILDGENEFYSNLCKTNKDPESDYVNIKNSLDRVGFDIDSLKNLFSAESDRIVGGETVFTGIENNGLDCYSGVCDTYFYFMLKEIGLDYNRIELGGDGWSTEADPEEILIRYRYGYHNTKYGKLMLLQSGLTIDRFREIAYLEIKKIVKDCFYDSLRSVVRRNDDNARAIREVEKNIEDFLYFNEDNIVINCRKISAQLSTLIDGNIPPSEISKYYSSNISSYFYLDTNYENGLLTLYDIH